MTDIEMALLWLESFVKNEEPMTLIPKQLIKLMYDALKEQQRTILALKMDKEHLMNLIN